MISDERAAPARAIDLLSSEGADAVLSEPWALAALADPGQWAGDVERALSALSTAHRQAIRRAGRAVLRAARAESATVVPFPGGPPQPQPAPSTPLILAARGGCWVRCAGRYVSVPAEVAVQELVRQGHDSLQAQGPHGWRPLQFPDAYSRVGAVVSRIVYVLGASEDRYDSADRTLYQGCGTPDPALEPHRSPDVARWLYALVGGDDRAHGRLLDWLSASWRLDRPTAALYLQGPGSTGKSMLAQALQRCYGTTTTTYADVVLGTYSAGIVRQPIVWLDERAPEDRGGKGTAAFRSLIGNRSHQYAEKYERSGTITGCPRLIVTANNDDALRFGREDLTRDDLEAIALRILHLEVSAEAVAYLQSVDTSAWVDDGPRPGALCRHLAWLRDHHAWTADSQRLLVQGEPGAWLLRQSTQSGLAQEVLVALVRALTDLELAEDPVTRDQPARHLVSVAEGHVLVGATDLHRAWPLLSGDRSGRITVARLGRVLRGLAGHVRAAGASRRHPIPNDLLREACRSIHGTDDLLDGRLA